MAIAVAWSSCSSEHAFASPLWACQQVMMHHLIGAIKKSLTSNKHMWWFLLDELGRQQSLKKKLAEHMRAMRAFDSTNSVSSSSTSSSGSVRRMTAEPLQPLFQFQHPLQWNSLWSLGQLKQQTLKNWKPSQMVGDHPQFWHGMFLMYIVLSAARCKCMENLPVVGCHFSHLAPAAGERLQLRTLARRWHQELEAWSGHIGH